MTPFDLSFSRNIILSSLFSYYIFVRYLCIDRSFFRSFPLFPLFDRFIEGKYARITRKYRYYRKYRIYTPFFAKNKIGWDERIEFLFAINLTVCSPDKKFEMMMANKI